MAPQVSVRRGRMSEIGAARWHFVMPFTSVARPKKSSKRNIKHYTHSDNDTEALRCP